MEVLPASYSIYVTGTNSQPHLGFGTTTGEGTSSIYFDDNDNQLHFVDGDKSLSDLNQRKEKTMNIYRYFIIDRVNNKILESGDVVGRSIEAAAVKVNGSKYANEIDADEIVIKLSIQTSYNELETVRTKQVK